MNVKKLKARACLPVRQGHGTLALTLVALGSFSVGVAIGILAGYVIEGGELPLPRRWIESDIDEGPDAG